MKRSHQSAPYSSRELENARTYLIRDFEYGSQRSLHYRLQRHPVDGRDSRSVPNVWEGDEGMMEHVLCGFPMPQQGHSTESSGSIKEESSSPQSSDSDMVSIGDAAAKESASKPRKRKREGEESSQASSDLILAFTGTDSCSSQKGIPTPNRILDGQPKGNERKPVVKYDTEDQKDVAQSNSDLDSSEKKSLTSEGWFWIRLSHIKEEISTVRDQLIKSKKRMKKDSSYLCSMACKEMMEVYRKIRISDSKLSKEKWEKNENNYVDSFDYSDEVKKQYLAHYQTELVELAINFSEVETSLKGLKKQFKLILQHYVKDIDPHGKMFGRTLPSVNHLFSEPCESSKGQDSESEILSKDDSYEEVGNSSLKRDDNLKTPTSSAHTSDVVHTGSKLPRLEKNIPNESDAPTGNMKKLNSQRKILQKSLQNPNGESRSSILQDKGGRDFTQQSELDFYGDKRLDTCTDNEIIGDCSSMVKDSRNDAGLAGSNCHLNREDMFWKKLTDLREDVLRNNASLKDANDSCKNPKKQENGASIKLAYELMMGVHGKIKSFSERISSLKEEMETNRYVERGPFGQEELKKLRIAHMKRNFNSVDVVDALFRNLKASFMRMSHQKAPILVKMKFIKSADELTFSLDKCEAEVQRWCAHTDPDTHKDGESSDSVTPTNTSGIPTAVPSHDSHLLFSKRAFQQNSGDCPESSKSSHFDSLASKTSGICNFSDASSHTKLCASSDFVEQEKQHWDRLQELYCTADKCNERVKKLLKLSQMNLQKRADWAGKEDNKKNMESLKFEINRIAKNLSAEDSESRRQGYCKVVFYKNLELKSQKGARNLIKSLDQVRGSLSILQGNFKKLVSRFSMHYLLK